MPRTPQACFGRQALNHIEPSGRKPPFSDRVADRRDANTNSSCDSPATDDVADFGYRMGECVIHERQDCSDNLDCQGSGRHQFNFLGQLAICEA
ncbi:hypothetical protein VB636_20805 [Paracoccus sp. APAP_BH8]|uniref:hypothetical protein n=1 Tax=Paracoccus sp. APAP_BH8 TaxID=3110237 RepID=UPI002FD7B222